MSKVTLTRIFRKDVDTRFGIKPKVGIQTKEHEDKWLSTFKVAGTENWEEGMEVEINIIEKGDFMNFSVVGSSNTPSPSITNKLEDRVSKLEYEVFRKKEPETESETEKDEEKSSDKEF